MMDAVISWVNGYDTAYQNKLNSFCLEKGLEPRDAIDPTRYQQHNEIYYCLLSLKCFAPWIETIYIITPNQRPEALDAFSNTAFGEKIKIIDQNKLLENWGIHTPIFNSLGVEWLMWHIEGLSDEFLYLNDDFFILRPVKTTDFFKEGRLILRGEWKTQSTCKLENRLKNWMKIPVHIDPHRTWQEQSAILAGFKRRFYLLPHAPFPLKKQTALSYMAKNAWIDNLHYPFRHQNHVSSIPLMTHLEIQAGHTIQDHYLKTMMVNPGHHSIKKIKQRLSKASKNKAFKFMCVQSLDQASPQVRDFILHWLKEHIEEPCHAIHY
jgi:hypothetical protein